VNQSSCLKYKNKNGSPTQKLTQTMQSRSSSKNVSLSQFTTGCSGLAYTMDHEIPYTPM